MVLQVFFQIGFVYQVVFIKEVDCLLILPDPRVGGVWPYEKVILLVGDEVDSSKVHGLVATIEADVAFFGLSSVTRRPDDQAVDVGKNALILGVGVSTGHGSFNSYTTSL